MTNEGESPESDARATESRLAHVRAEALPAAITAMGQSLLVFHLPSLNGALLHHSFPVSRLYIAVFGEEMMGTGGDSVWGPNVADFVSRIYSGASRHVCTSHGAF